MSLSGEVRSHHTVWVTVEGRAPVALRYATTDDDIVCFGDDELAAVPAGTRVAASVHAIAGGPPVATFGAVVRDLDADDVPLGLVADVVGNLSLTGDPVTALDALRHERRLVALHP